MLRGRTSITDRRSATKANSTNTSNSTTSTTNNTGDDMCSNCQVSYDNALRAAQEEMREKRMSKKQIERQSQNLLRLMQQADHSTSRYVHKGNGRRRQKSKSTF
eukprot:79094-Rhodomonas_salina.1